MIKISIYECHKSTVKTTCFANNPLPLTDSRGQTTTLVKKQLRKRLTVRTTAYIITISSGKARVQKAAPNKGDSCQDTREYLSQYVSVKSLITQTGVRTLGRFLVLNQSGPRTHFSSSLSEVQALSVIRVKSLSSPLASTFSTQMEIKNPFSLHHLQICVQLLSPVCISLRQIHGCVCDLRCRDFQERLELLVLTPT